MVPGVNFGVDHLPTIAENFGSHLKFVVAAVMHGLSTRLTIIRHSVI